MSTPDLLVVGAGPVGCIVARHAADAGLSVLVVDRRPHLAGNCYDAPVEGVLTHQYGPHYFRTNDADLLQWLARFTRWQPGRYVVQAVVGDKRYPVPVNRRTLELHYGVQLADDVAAQALLDRVRVPCAAPTNAEQYAHAQVGPGLYEALLLGYTWKQWGAHPRDLSPALFGRLPVRTDEDDRYVQHRYQLMPGDGFTAMFQAMLSHRGITVQLSTPYAQVRGACRPRVATVYTGPLDEYFGCRLGRLPWRSLRFEYAVLPVKYAQPCVQLNYPSLEVDYTRTVECKHVTGQLVDHTVVATEYPQAQGDPYYPVPTEDAAQLADEYRALAAQATRTDRVWFAGRLAEYRYLNTDEALLRGIATWQEVVRTCRALGG